jgi:hypothetical protein
VLVMAFTLVYTAEHFVIDILLGWALAVVVIAAINYYESRRTRAWAHAHGPTRKQGTGDGRKMPTIVGVSRADAVVPYLRVGPRGD